MSGEPLCIHLPGYGVGHGDALHVLHHPLHHGHVQKIRIQKENKKLVPIYFQLHLNFPLLILMKTVTFRTHSFDEIYEYWSKKAYLFLLNI